MSNQRGEAEHAPDPNVQAPEDAGLTGGAGRKVLDDEAAEAPGESGETPQGA